MNEYKETTMECLFKMILIKVSEMSERRKVAKIPDRYDELFQNLRSQVYLEPSKDWHVSECAGDNGLSTPYFQKFIFWKYVCAGCCTEPDGARQTFFAGFQLFD